MEGRKIVDRTRLRALAHTDAYARNLRIPYYEQLHCRILIVHVCERVSIYVLFLLPLPPPLPLLLLYISTCLYSWMTILLLRLLLLFLLHLLYRFKRCLRFHQLRSFLRLVKIREKRKLYRIDRL